MSQSPDNETKDRLKLLASGFWGRFKDIMITGPRKKTKRESRRQLDATLKRRAYYAGGVVLGLILFLCTVVIIMSTTTHEEYSLQTLQQMNYSSSTLVARSGDIYDANMTPLAVSTRVYILILDPKVMMSYEDMQSHKGTLRLTAETLEECFGLDAQEIVETVVENSEKSYLRFVSEADRFDEDGNPRNVTKTLVTEEQKQHFEELADLANGVTKTTAATDENGEEIKTEAPKAVPNIRGVWFETEYRRNYPYDSLASKVIGFTTTDVSEGIWGLERYYDDVLRGTNGRSFRYINEDGNLRQDVEEQEDGCSLVSTIDINLTRLITDAAETWFEHETEDGVTRSARAWNVIAMDPNTGAVKAMVTSTDYNLNSPMDMSSFYTEEELAQFEYNTGLKAAWTDWLAAYYETHDPEDGQPEDCPYDDYLKDGQWNEAEYPTETQMRNQVWRNGIISDSYEPGSTGKVITYSAALEEGCITPDTIFNDDEGYLMFGSTMVKCHNYDTGGCKTITAEQSVAESCNVAFMEMGEMLGPENFSRYQKLHNFGQKTGIDLPGETSCEGLLYNAEDLHPLELATNAFGQCFNVTMLQLAAAVCADINGGYYYKPYVVSEILNPDGTTKEKIEPVLVRQVISERSSAQVRSAMENAVDNGTAYGIQVVSPEEGLEMKGYHFGGKTGTAQKLPRSENKYIISVISAAPMDAPKLLLYVTIDEYEGDEEDEGSAPAQYLSGAIWYAIKDYIGLYSDNAPANPVNIPAAPHSDSYGEDEAFFIRTDDAEAEVPLPPEEEKEEEQEAIVNPNTIYNPEEAIENPETPAGTP